MNYNNINIVLRYSATEKFDRCLRRRYRQVFSINRYVYIQYYDCKQ